MTDNEHALDRPGFESVDLDVDVEETRNYIERAVAGLSNAETDAGVNYRTTDGTLVAVVGPRSSGNDDVEARLAYRTEPPHEIGTRKATHIVEALGQHVVDK